MSNSDKLNKPRLRSPVPIDECGVGLATQIFGDRWSFLIIREAFYGVKRYDDIRTDLGIPRSVLTSRLKNLVGAGIFVREPYQEEGARTRYAYGLSLKGKELGLTILALMQWGDAHLKQGGSAINLKHKDTGRSLKVGLIEDCGNEISLDDVRISLAK